MKTGKRIITYGTFDLLHYGHIKILEKAKAIGGYLIVGVSTDEFNDMKNKKAYYNYQKRKKMIESLECVDEVIKESSWEQKIIDIKKYNIDVFVIGDDWIGKFDYLNEYCEVIYIERTPNISSSELRERLRL